MVFRQFLPDQTKKNVVKVGPSLTKLSGSAHVVVTDKCGVYKVHLPIILERGSGSI